MTILRKHGIWSSLAILPLILGFQIAAAQSSTDSKAAADSTKAAKSRAEVDAASTDVLKEFRGMKGADALFNKAAGYATFKVTKAGLGASGAGGGGVAVDKKSGARTYMRMGSAGVGFTAGFSRYDIVILFETTEKFNAFVKGGWDSSATAQAAAGTKGVDVESTFFEGVAYYQIGRKGLMASADVTGTKFWVDDLNQK